MQCYICHRDSVGEVCNACIRMEKNTYNHDYKYKEGLIVKKTEDMHISVSNARISGTAVISTSSSGMNAKIDGFNHFIGGVLGVEACTYNGKPAPGIHVKTPSGMERYLIFPQMTDEAGLKSGIAQAKSSQMSGDGPAAGSAGGASLTAEQQQRLSKLNLLKQNGILSDAEYQAEKAKLGL